nr:cyclomaltodextrinase C-terminal domain-containing protein [Bacteroidota bacterium]
ELALTGTTSPNDGHVRQDFPGGWSSDLLNKFTATGRNKLEQSIWTYITTLANFRKNSSALTTGKMMQYVPVDGVYVYFRYDNTQTIMVVMNTSKEEKNILPEKFAERTESFKEYRNILTGDKKPLGHFSLGSKQRVVLELLK